MKVYGYLRVSTDEQDYNSQKQGVDEFAKNKSWMIDEYITDDGVSGGKDPSKRKLGDLLNKIKEKDIIIASEISRLGRDLLMVMEILNHCMKTGAVVYTVKDNYVLGDDVQSKVLAFAFGLSAEIERKMIQMRTKEGLALRIKKGILLGRPYKDKQETKANVAIKPDKEEQIVFQYNIGVPIRRIAINFNVGRDAISYFLASKNLLPDSEKIVERVNKANKKHREESSLNYFKDDPLQIVNLDKTFIKALIENNLTIPEIHEKLKKYTYRQVYDTIYADYDLNTLYRKHGQKRLKGVK